MKAQLNPFVGEEQAPAEGRAQQELARRTGRAHLAYVDGLRALAALYVVFDHARLEVWIGGRGHQAPGTIARLTDWSTYGEFAVAFFIVISGFCLMLPVARGDGFLRGGAVAFLKRRARRILPPFYAAMLLSLILIWTAIGTKTGTHWDVSIPVGTAGYLGNIFLLQDVLGVSKINHAFWSIALEWQIYFLFPLLVLCWRRFGVKRSALTAIVVAYVVFLGLHAFSQAGPFYLKGFRAEFVGLFVLGMLAATIAFSPKPIWARMRRVPWAGLAGVFALVTIGGCLVAGARTPHLIGFLDFPVGLTALSILVAGARVEERNRIRDLLGMRWLAFLGAFSYSIYLIHAPLLQVEWQYVLRPLHLAPAETYVLLLVPGIPVIVGLTYLFFLPFERPFMSTRQKRAAEGEFVEAGRAAEPAVAVEAVEPNTAVA